MSESPDEELNAVQASLLLNMTPGMLRSRVERRQAPAPAGRVLGRPVWSRVAIEEWLEKNRRR